MRMLLLIFTWFGALVVARGSPILLFPSDEELVIKSGSELKIKCEAKEKIMWNYTVQADDVSSEKHDIENRTKIDFRENKQSDYPFQSEITVSNASYLDTGYFSCAHVGTTNFENFFEAKRIYVYVDDDAHSLALPGNEVSLVHAIARHRAILPCKPTAPSISVELHRDGDVVYPINSNDVYDHISFDPKIGFTINSAGMTDAGEYKCVTKRNSTITDEYTIYVFVQPESNSPPQPVIHRNTANHVQIGSNFTLICTAMYPLGGNIHLNWSFPDSSGVTTGRINITEPIRSGEVTEDEFKATTTLTVFRSQSFDAGKYTCRAENHQGQIGEDDEFVEIFEEDHTFLNVTIDVLAIEVSAGGVARWVAHVHAHPTAQVIWKNPKGEEMKTESNVVVSTVGTDSILSISSVQLRDSGYYEFTAKSGNESKIERLSLKVREKPVASIENPKIFLQMNQRHLIKCSAEGYPLATITWKFRECSSPSDCKPFQTVDSNNFNNESLPRLTDELIKRTSDIQLIANQSGEYLCRAVNSLGGYEVTTKLYVTASKDGLDLKGHSSLYEGENLSLRCGITLFNYTRPISWKFMANCCNTMVDLTENEGGVLMFRDMDRFGFNETLEISNVSLKNSGTYFCFATSLEGVKVNEKIDVLIGTQIKPFIVSHNLEARTEIEKGKQMLLQCNVTGKPLPKVTWTKDGAKISSSDEYTLTYDEAKGSANLKIPFAKENQTGFYKCAFLSIAGKAEMITEIVVIEPPLSAWLISVGGILSVVVIVLLIALFIKTRKERRRKAFLALHKLEKFEEGDPGSINPEQTLDEQADLLPYNKKSWEFPKDRLKMGKQLGAGAFGRVVQAVAYGIVEDEIKTTVAVKMLKPSPDAQALTALVKELKVMTNLGKHLNVVNLLGACTRNIDKGELLLVVEYCKFGSLQKYVQKKKATFIDQVDRRTSKVDISIGYDRLQRTWSGASQRNGNVTYVNLRPNRTVSSNAPLLPPDSPLINFSPSPTSRDAPAGLYGQENGAMTYVPMSPIRGSSGEDSGGPAFGPWALSYRGDVDEKPLCTNDLMCWAYQLTSGMEYLASRKVCHGDLAARNVLLSENNIVKICDFGLAREVYRSGLYTKKSDTPVPVKWMAPESIRNRIFSTQSDVWSFGVTLWEIFTLGEMPYAGIEANRKFVESLERGDGILKMPNYAPRDIYDVMKECWLREPKARPNFTGLKEHIGNLLDETTRQMYMDLNQSYITMNQAQFQDRIDYLIQMSNPVYENFQPEEGLFSHEHINSPRPLLDVADDGYLSPNQAIVNNTGYMIGVPGVHPVNGQVQTNSGSQVFLFPGGPATLKRLSKLDEEPTETQPMLQDEGYLQPRAVNSLIQFS